MKGFRYLKNVATLAYDRDACIGCGACAEVCPHRIFTLEGDKAVLGDPDLCMECGACERNCPAEAIRVDAGVGCASGMINEWLADTFPRLRKNVGGCC